MILNGRKESPILKGEKIMKINTGIGFISGILVFLTLSLCCVGGSDGGEPRLLFNGKDLSGWTTFNQGRGRGNDPLGVFTVQDGLLRISGEEYGGLTTEESFSDYRCSLEFKWGEKTYGKRKGKARDSGFLFHSVGEDGNYKGVWIKSFEANIIEGGVGDFWLVGGQEDGYQATCVVSGSGQARLFDPENGKPMTFTDHADGPFRWSGFDPDWKDVYGFRGKNDQNDPNGWTRLDVVAEGDTAEFYVNGRLVNRVTDLGRTSGKIQLQSEGAEIYYRNIVIESLGGE